MSNDQRCRLKRSKALVSQSLEPARARADRDDVDLEPAIRLDAVHRAAQCQAWDHAGRAAMDLLAVDHPADLVLAAAGLSGRQIRAAPSDLDRRADVGRRLRAVELCRQRL